MRKPCRDLQEAEAKSVAVLSHLTDLTIAPVCTPARCLTHFVQLSESLVSLCLGWDVLKSTTSGQPLPATSLCGLTALTRLWLGNMEFEAGGKLLPEGCCLCAFTLRFLLR